MSKIKWIAPKGKYTVTRVEQIDCRVNYRHSQTGKTMTGPDGGPVTIRATRIVAFAGDVPVLSVTVAGSHTQTLANYRASMARKIQDEGGSWMGRTEATETAKADRLCDIMHNGAGDFTPSERKRIRDHHYNGMPHPSTY